MTEISAAIRGVACKGYGKGIIAMMYIWFIPLALILLVMIVMLMKGGTKRPTPGKSRMDQVDE